MYDTDWSMFTPPPKSTSPPQFKNSYADRHHQQYHQGPPPTYHHHMYYQQQGFYSLDQQPVRSVFESSPAPSSKVTMLQHPYHPPQHRLHPYHHPLDQLQQLPPLFMGKRFSVPLTQQQQQEQQQKFLHHSTTFDNRKSLHTANSWATPGNPVSETRSSCPNIFLAPDLFASTSLRRASIPVTGPPSHL
jgi:hypothetical protein